MNQGADFSTDGKYRFALWRIWNDKPLIMFIGLNPSTANAQKNDPTINRVMRFAYDWGYGGVFMMNLFPFITAYPSMLIKDRMEENDEYIHRVAEKCGKVIFAWGNFPKHTAGRDKQVMAMFPDACCLGKTSGGHPLHPLFKPAKLTPKPFFE
jgi:hypothetical protein